MGPGGPLCFSSIIIAASELFGSRGVSSLLALMVPIGGPLSVCKFILGIRLGGLLAGTMDSFRCP